MSQKGFEAPCAAVFGCISFCCSQQRLQARRWRTLMRHCRRTMSGLEIRAVNAAREPDVRVVLEIASRLIRRGHGVSGEAFEYRKQPKRSQNPHMLHGPSRTPYGLV